MDGMCRLKTQGSLSKIWNESVTEINHLETKTNTKCYAFSLLITQ